MTPDSMHSAGLTREQVEVFADGLFHVACVGGVHPNEEALVREFLRETDCAHYEANLGSRAFEVERAVQVLHTSFLRRLFIKACVLMVHADHQVSEEELELLQFLASAFGLAGDLPALMQEVEGQSLA